MKINKNFILREIAGDYVLVPVGKTALEFNGMITVNETGAFLWTALQEECTEESLVNAVLKEYDAGRREAEQDVSDFLEILREKKILEE